MEDPWYAGIMANGMLKAPQAGDTDAPQKVTLGCMLMSDTCLTGFVK